MEKSPKFAYIYVLFKEQLRNSKILSNSPFEAKKKIFFHRLKMYTTLCALMWRSIFYPHSAE